MRSELDEAHKELVRLEFVLDMMGRDRASYTAAHNLLFTLARLARIQIERAIAKCPAK